MSRSTACDIGEECVTDHRNGMNSFCRFCNENVSLSVRKEADVKTASALLMNLLPADSSIPNVNALHLLIYITLMEGCLNSIENGILKSHFWSRRNFIENYDSVESCIYIFREWEKSSVPIDLSGCVFDGGLVLGFHLAPFINEDGIPPAIIIEETIRNLKNDSNLLALKKYGVELRFGTDTCSFLCKINSNIDPLVAVAHD
jgi:hypothetical protein